MGKLKKSPTWRFLWLVIYMLHIVNVGGPYGARGKTFLELVAEMYRCLSLEYFDRSVF
jgi:hypothetical protein